MLNKTRGIVFRLTPYGETSVIINVFTELFGLQSYIVNGVRNKSARSKIALYQPLTLLDMVVYHKENAGILRIKEASCAHPYHTLTVDHKKSSIAIFINEILNKTVKEQSHVQELCDFIFDSLIALDRLPTQVENFHLIFLLRLSKHLGFGPENTIEIGALMLNEKEDYVLDQLLTANYDSVIRLTNEQRRNILEGLLRFYASHVDSLGTIKSVQVLREVLG